MFKCTGIYALSLEGLMGTSITEGGTQKWPKHLRLSKPTGALSDGSISFSHFGDVFSEFFTKHVIP
jgi:hypothetical protein